MEVTLTKISDHGRTRKGQPAANGKPTRQTTLGHSQFVIVSGSGSKRTSRTVHCLPMEAENIKKSLQ